LAGNVERKRRLPHAADSSLGNFVASRFTLRADIRDPLAGGPLAGARGAGIPRTRGPKTPRISDAGGLSNGSVVLKHHATVQGPDTRGGGGNGLPPTSTVPFSVAELAGRNPQR